MAANDSTAQVINSSEDFSDNPKGNASKWAVEMAAAEKAEKEWWNASDKIVKRFLDLRDGASNKDLTRLNIFTSNVQTLRANLYGKMPKVDVGRRYEDSEDDVARVAGVMMERLLNTDIEDDEDGYTTSIGHALDDRILVGFGNVRARYEAEFEMGQPTEAILDATSGEELAPEVPGVEEKTSEHVAFDYVYWKDQLWSAARTFGEVRWWAFRVYMTRDQVAERFGKKHADAIPFNARSSGKDKEDVNKFNPWKRAEVWEIWSKDDEKVYWWVKGYDQTLDEKDDPYELEGFWPFPRPMLANTTTTSFMPRPEFMLAQDLYNEIDYVSTRITLLERAVKVVGCYDSSADGVRRLMTEGFDNDLIPVVNWPLFAEKGGMNGAISWLPIEPVIAALDKLRDYRAELIKLTYEVTGMSDIMRGATDAGETATAQAIKAKFGSIRMQAMQDEFARFCTDLLKIKAELVIKLYDDDTIIEESNIMYTPDARLAPQALQVLRTQSARYRLEVKAESVSLTDYAVLRQERTEFVQSLTMFMQAMAPMAQQMPGSMPYTLEMLKWVMAGFKGGSTIEGVLDQAITAAKQDLATPKPPPPPDPKLLIEKARAEADIQTSNVETQNKIRVENMKAATDIQVKQQELQMQQREHEQKMVQDAQANQQKLEADAAKARQELTVMLAKWRTETIAKTGYDPETGEMVSDDVEASTGKPLDG